MDTQIVAIYCICDDILKGLHHVEDKQRKMSDAEVMTTSIVAALFFGEIWNDLGSFCKSKVIFLRCWRKAGSTVANIRWLVCSWPCSTCWAKSGNK